MCRVEMFGFVVLLPGFGSFEARAAVAFLRWWGGGGFRLLEGGGRFCFFWCSCFSPGFCRAGRASGDCEFREFLAGAGDQRFGNDEDEDGDPQRDRQAGLRDERRAQPGG